jgi:hypothetical protein
MPDEYKTLSGRLDEERPLGRPTRRRRYQNGCYGNRVLRCGPDSYQLLKEDCLTSEPKAYKEEYSDIAATPHFISL